MNAIAVARIEEAISHFPALLLSERYSMDPMYKLSLQKVLSGDLNSIPFAHGILPVLPCSLSLPDNHYQPENQQEYHSFETTKGYQYHSERFHSPALVLPHQARHFSERYHPDERRTGENDLRAKWEQTGRCYRIFQEQLLLKRINPTCSSSF
jgi:hypothetical protein